MPFSMTVRDSQSYHMLPFGKTSKEKKKKKIVTLQVRILSRLYFKWLSTCHGKKAFLSASGSMTLEAAMCLTLFVFASVCLLLPMKVMNTERRIQAAMEMIGEDYSRYAYLYQALEQGKTFASVNAGDGERGFCRYLVSGVGIGYAQAQVMEQVDTSAVARTSMLGSQILTDGEMIDLVFDYEIRLPFSVLGLNAWKRTARCRRRAWVGLEGKSYDSAGNRAEDDKNMTVYVGRDSTRYHKDRNCHYLSNRLTAVSADQVGELRSKSGGKYRPCAVCGSHASGIVYILPNGESYHSDQNCRAITAYVRTAKLCDVEHLGPCSYCSK